MQLRRILLLLGLLGLLLAIFSTFGNLHGVVLAFTQVHWYVVPLVIATQLISYYAGARYYQTFLDHFGNHLPLRRVYESALALNFANQAIPSGGVSGTAYLTQAFKPYDVPPGRTALTQLGRYGFTFISFFVVLAFGFVTLFFTNDLDKVSIRLVVFLMYVILILGAVILVIFSEKRRLTAFIRPFVRSLNWLGRRFRRTTPIVTDAKLADFLEELYRGYHQIASHRRHWPKLLFWTLGVNIAEVLTVYMVFIGFGAWVNPGIVITGYALAIAASIGGILVGGLGVYEAGMIGAFAALGIPFALAFAVVIVYRILNMGLFLPVGLYFYRRHLATPPQQRETTT